MVETIPQENRRHFYKTRRYFSPCVAHVTMIMIAIRDSRSGTTGRVFFLFLSVSPSFFFSLSVCVSVFHGKFRWRIRTRLGSRWRSEATKKHGFRAKSMQTDKVPLTSSIFCSHPVMVLPYLIAYSSTVATTVPLLFPISV